MTDLSHTIAPKSDQLNADDLIAGPMTITITHVSACPSSAEQPIAIAFEGDNGKPYKPCKSMRRLFVAVWGKDGAAYAGRQIRLYRDPEVMFGGVKVGGIRISHMSHIDAAKTVALTTTRGARKPYTVKPLASQPAASSRAAHTDGGGAHPPQPPPSNSFPADLVKFGKRSFDPASPIDLPYFDDFEDDEWRAYAAALRKLIERAETPALKRAWERANQDGLLVLGAQKPALRAFVFEVLPVSAAPSSTAAAGNEGAPGADGMGLSGAPSTFNQGAVG